MTERMTLLDLFDVTYDVVPVISLGHHNNEVELASPTACVRERVVTYDEEPCAVKDQWLECKLSFCRLIVESGDISQLGILFFRCQFEPRRDQLNGCGNIGSDCHANILCEGPLTPEFLLQCGRYQTCALICQLESAGSVPLPLDRRAVAPLFNFVWCDLLPLL